MKTRYDTERILVAYYGSTDLSCPIGKNEFFPFCFNSCDHA